MPPQSSRKNLRTTLYYLRQAIDDYLSDDADEEQAIPFLPSDRNTVQIHPAYPVTLDLERFLQLLDGPSSGWPEAIAIYQDDFLAGFSISEANTFEEWAAGHLPKYEKAVELCETGLAIFPELGDEPGADYGFTVLRELTRCAGGYEKARNAYEACLAICL